MTVADAKRDAEARMKKCVESLGSEYAKLRTGRAHPHLLEHIRVPSYGNEVPLTQVASVTVSDPRTLLVTPWDRTMTAAIEKAILTSDLGLNPATAGQVIRIPMPPLTETRRKDLIKVVKSEAEQAKVSIRNIRRDTNTQFKNLLKDHEISEDEEHRAQDLIQKLTDQYVDSVEKLALGKEKDLMEG